MEKTDLKLSTEWQQPINICRCCLTEGCYKDISTEYFSSGQKEVYAEMLLETFNVIISYQEGGGPSSCSRLICDECIIRLRNAHGFKKLVLHSEEMFKERLEKLRGGHVKIDEVKEEEIKGEGMDQCSDEFNIGSPDDDMSFDDVTLAAIKIEQLKEEPAEDCQVGVETPVMTRRSARKRSQAERKAEKPAKKLKTTKRSNQKNKRNDKPSCSETTKGKMRNTTRERKRKNDSLKMIMIKQINENTLKLIKHSNLTLFTWTKTKYRCFYCEKCFMDMMELKEHEAVHAWDEIEKKIILIRQTALRKADISSLACKLCSLKCENLNDLMQHLWVHDVIFSNSNHLLIPYRLDSGKFVCEFCQESFNVFIKLSSHMNVHYQNHVCEVCGNAFANRQNLRIHVRNAHDSTKCTICDKVFKNGAEKNRHRAKVHEVKNRRYCPMCNEVLSSAYAKMLHMNAVHGVSLPEFKCLSCDRIFKAKFFLNSHVRKVHNKEKNHACDKCSMRFYTTADLKRHIRSHDSTKTISCAYCDTMFKNKDTWRKHMKRTHSELNQ